MARPREFDYDQVLNRAMETFWVKGFKATSLEDLLETMEISKSSFYETFGDKRQLFLSAIEAYTKLTTRRMIARLKEERNFIQTVDDILESVIHTAVTTKGKKGCMIANSAIELSPHDPEVEQIVAAELKRIENAYRDAIGQAQRRGEISKTKDASALARFMVCVLNGMVVVSKAKPDKASLRDIKQTVLEVLR